MQAAGSAKDVGSTSVAADADAASTNRRRVGSKRANGAVNGRRNREVMRPSLSTTRHMMRLTRHHCRRRHAAGTSRGLHRGARLAYAASPFFRTSKAEMASPDPRWRDRPVAVYAAAVFALLLWAGTPIANKISVAAIDPATAGLRSGGWAPRSSSSLPPLHCCRIAPSGPRSAPSAWLSVGYMALCSSFVGYIAWFWALGRGAESFSFSVSRRRSRLFASSLARHLVVVRRSPVAQVVVLTVLFQPRSSR